MTGNLDITGVEVLRYSIYMEDSSLKESIKNKAIEENLGVGNYTVTYDEDSKAITFEKKESTVTL